MALGNIISSETKERVLVPWEECNDMPLWIMLRRNKNLWDCFEMGAFVFTSCVMHKLMRLRPHSQELLVFLVSILSKFPLWRRILVLSVGSHLHDCNSIFGDALLTPKHTHSGVLWKTTQPVRVCSRVSALPRFFPSPTYQEQANCFSSTAHLALLWLEIGVLTQCLEDGLYLTLASSSQ